MPDEERMEAAGNVYKNGGRIDTGLDAVEWAMKANRLGAGEIHSDQHGLQMGTKAGV